MKNTIMILVMLLASQMTQAQRMYVGISLDESTETIQSRHVFYSNNGFVDQPQNFTNNFSTSKLGYSIGIQDLYVHSEKLSLDAGLIYQQSWFSDIISLNSNLSYKLNDKISVLAGLNYSVYVGGLPGVVSITEKQGRMGYQFGAEVKINEKMSVVIQQLHLNHQVDGNVYKSFGYSKDEMSFKNTVNSVGLIYGF